MTPNNTIGILSEFPAFVSRTLLSRLGSPTFGGLPSNNGV